MFEVVVEKEEDEGRYKVDKSLPFHHRGCDGVRKNSDDLIVMGVGDGRGLRQVIEVAVMRGHVIAV